MNDAEHLLVSIWDNATSILQARAMISFPGYSYAIQIEICNVLLRHVQICITVTPHYMYGNTSRTSFRGVEQLHLRR